MRKRVLATSMALAITMLTSGCYSMQHYVQNAGGEVSFTDNVGERDYHFREEGRYFYILWGLVPVVAPKADDLLAKHTRKGMKIRNLKVEQQYGPVDFAVSILSNWFTLGLIQSWGVAYEGDVVEEEK